MSDHKDNRIEGFEKANLDQGSQITSLRREVSGFRVELEKYMLGAVSYNEEIYQMGRELYELHEQRAEALIILKDAKVYIDTIHDDSDRRKMHKRIDALIPRMKGDT